MTENKRAGKGLMWPIAVTLVLLTVVGVNIWVAVIASDDPSFAIEPDYYRKAVAWDSSMAQAERNTTLGWTLGPRLSAFSDSGAALRVELRDARGAHIAGATVDVAARFNARAGTVLTARLATDASGAYVSTLPVHQQGVWELAFSVHRGTERFTYTTRVDATRLGGP